MPKWGVGVLPAPSQCALALFSRGVGGGVMGGGGGGKTSDRNNSWWREMVDGLVGGGMIASSVSWYELQRRQG
jgi:hypothetical protein